MDGVQSVSKTFGRQVLMYHSALTVFLSWSEAETTWPDSVKKTAIICFEMFLDFHKRALTWGKRD